MFSRLTGRRSEKPEPSSSKRKPRSGDSAKASRSSDAPSRRKKSSATSDDRPRRSHRDADERSTYSTHSSRRYDSRSARGGPSDDESDASSTSVASPSESYISGLRRQGERASKVSEEPAPRQSNRGTRISNPREDDPQYAESSTVKRDKPDVPSSSQSRSTQSARRRSEREVSRGLDSEYTNQNTHRDPARLDVTNPPYSVINQFPNQTPADFAVPAIRPQQPSKFGAAADFYEDQGESVMRQPGVRPHTPVIVGTEPHLMPASAVAAPPVETGHGAAAEFYTGASFDNIPATSGPASKPPRPVANPMGSSAKPNTIATSKPSLSGSSNGLGVGLMAAAAVAGTAAATSHHHSTTTPRPSNRPPKRPEYNPSRPHNGHYEHEHSHEYDETIQHEHDGPFDRFANWWNNYDDVRKFEEYTEYIGVCRYCFDSQSSLRDAPRRHLPRRRSSRELRERRRVDKETRYRKSDSSANAIGVAAAGVAGAAVASAAVASSTSGSRADAGDQAIRRRRGSNSPPSSRHRIQREYSEPRSPSRTNAERKSSVATQSTGILRAKDQSQAAESSSRRASSRLDRYDTDVHPSNRARRPKSPLGSVSSGSSSGSSSSQQRGFFSWILSSPRGSRRRHRRRSSEKSQATKNSRSSSVSSFEKSLAYGNDPISSRASGRSRKEPQQEFEPGKALVELGLASAALTAASMGQSRGDASITRRPARELLGARPQERVRFGPNQYHDLQADDEWESASEASDQSELSMNLAFGDSDARDSGSDTRPPSGPTNQVKTGGGRPVRGPGIAVKNRMPEDPFTQQMPGSFPQPDDGRPRQRKERIDILSEVEPRPEDSMLSYNKPKRASISNAPTSSIVRSPAKSLPLEQPQPRSVVKPPSPVDFENYDVKGNSLPRRSTWPRPVHTAEDDRKVPSNVVKGSAGAQSIPKDQRKRPRATAESSRRRSDVSSKDPEEARITASKRQGDSSEGPRTNQRRDETIGTTAAVAAMAGGVVALEQLRRRSSEERGSEQSVKESESSASEPQRGRRLQEQNRYPKKDASSSRNPQRQDDDVDASAMLPSSIASAPVPAASTYAVTDQRLPGNAITSASSVPTSMEDASVSRINSVVPSTILSEAPPNSRSARRHRVETRHAKDPSGEVTFADEDIMDPHLFKRRRVESEAAMKKAPPQPEPDAVNQVFKDIQEKYSADATKGDSSAFVAPDYFEDSGDYAPNTSADFKLEDQYGDSEPKQRGRNVPTLKLIPPTPQAGSVSSAASPRSMPPSPALDSWESVAEHQPTDEIPDALQSVGAGETVPHKIQEIVATPAITVSEAPDITQPESGIVPARLNESTMTNPRSVTWGTPNIFFYQVESPDSHREEYVSDADMHHADIEGSQKIAPEPFADDSMQEPSNAQGESGEASLKHRQEVEKLNGGRDHSESSAQRKLQSYQRPYAESVSDFSMYQENSRDDAFGAMEPYHNFNVDEHEDEGYQEPTFSSKPLPLVESVTSTSPFRDAEPKAAALNDSSSDTDSQPVKRDGGTSELFQPLALTGAAATSYIADSPKSEAGTPSAVQAKPSAETRLSTTQRVGESKMPGSFSDEEPEESQQGTEIDREIPGGKNGTPKEIVPAERRGAQEPAKTATSEDWPADEEYAQGDEEGFQSQKSRKKKKKSRRVYAEDDISSQIGEDMTSSLPSLSELRSSRTSVQDFDIHKRDSSAPSEVKPYTNDDDDYGTSKKSRKKEKRRSGGIFSFLDRPGSPEMKDATRSSVLGPLDDNSQVSAVSAPPFMSKEQKKKSKRTSRSYSIDEDDSKDEQDSTTIPEAVKAPGPKRDEDSSSKLANERSSRSEADATQDDSFRDDSPRGMSSQLPSAKPSDEPLVKNVERSLAKVAESRPSLGHSRSSSRTQILDPSSLEELMGSVDPLAMAVLTKLPESRPDSPTDQTKPSPQPAESTTSKSLSTTAIPMTLRFRHPPQSPRSPRTTVESNSGQDSISSGGRPSSKFKGSRPSSTEFRSDEWRPLYLVERNSKPNPKSEDEEFPSLPSSNTSSRTSSIHESEGSNDSTANDLESDFRSPRSRRRPAPIDTSRDREIEPYLNSQQSTPRAVPFSIDSEEASLGDTGISVGTVLSGALAGGLIAYDASKKDEAKMQDSAVPEMLEKQREHIPAVIEKDAKSYNSRAPVESSIQRQYSESEASLLLQSEPPGPTITSDKREAQGFSDTSKGLSDTPEATEQKPTGDLTLGTVEENPYRDESSLSTRDTFEAQSVLQSSPLLERPIYPKGNAPFSMQREAESPVPALMDDLHASILGNDPSTQSPSSETKLQPLSTSGQIQIPKLGSHKIEPVASKSASSTAEDREGHVNVSSTRQNKAREKKSKRIKSRSEPGIKLPEIRGTDTAQERADPSPEHASDMTKEPGDSGELNNDSDEPAKHAIGVQSTLSVVPDAPLRDDRVDQESMEVNQSEYDALLPDLSEQMRGSSARRGSIPSDASVLYEPLRSSTALLAGEAVRAAFESEASPASAAKDSTGFEPGRGKRKTKGKKKNQKASNVPRDSGEVDLKVMTNKGATPKGVHDSTDPKSEQAPVSPVETIQERASDIQEDGENTKPERSSQDSEKSTSHPGIGSEEDPVPLESVETQASTQAERSFEGLDAYDTIVRALTPEKFHGAISSTELGDESSPLAASTLESLSGNELTKSVIIEEPTSNKTFDDSTARPGAGSPITMQDWNPAMLPVLPLSQRDECSTPKFHAVVDTDLLADDQRNQSHTPRTERAPKRVTNASGTPNDGLGGSTIRKSAADVANARHVQMRPHEVDSKSLQEWNPAMLPMLPSAFTPKAATQKPKIEESYLSSDNQLGVEFVQPSKRKLPRLGLATRQSSPQQKSENGEQTERDYDRSPTVTLPETLRIDDTITRVLASSSRTPEGAVLQETWYHKDDTIGIGADSPVDRVRYMQQRSLLSEPSSPSFSDAKSIPISEPASTAGRIQHAVGVDEKSGDTTLQGQEQAPLSDLAAHATEESSHAPVSDKNFWHPACLPSANRAHMPDALLHARIQQQSLEVEERRRRRGGTHIVPLISREGSSGILEHDNTTFADDSDVDYPSNVPFTVKAMEQRPQAAPYAQAPSAYSESLFVVQHAANEAQYGDQLRKIVGEAAMTVMPAALDSEAQFERMTPDRGHTALPARTEIIHLAEDANAQIGEAHIASDLSQARDADCEPSARRIHEVEDSHRLEFPEAEKAKYEMKHTSATGYSMDIENCLLPAGLPDLPDIPSEMPMEYAELSAYMLRPATNVSGTHGKNATDTVTIESPGVKILPDSADITQNLSPSLDSSEALAEGQDAARSSGMSTASPRAKYTYGERTEEDFETLTEKSSAAQGDESRTSEVEHVRQTRSKGPQSANTSGVPKLRNSSKMSDLAALLTGTASTTAKGKAKKDKKKTKRKQKAQETAAVRLADSLEDDTSIASHTTAEGATIEDAAASHESFAKIEAEGLNEEQRLPADVDNLENNDVEKDSGPESSSALRENTSHSTDSPQSDCHHASNTKAALFSGDYNSSRADEDSSFTALQQASPIVEEDVDGLAPGSTERPRPSVPEPEDSHRNVERTFEGVAQDAATNVSDDAPMPSDHERHPDGPASATGAKSQERPSFSNSMISSKSKGSIFALSRSATSIPESETKLHSPATNLGVMKKIEASDHDRTLDSLIEAGLGGDSQLSNTYESFLAEERASALNDNAPEFGPASKDLKSNSGRSMSPTELWGVHQAPRTSSKQASPKHSNSTLKEVLQAPDSPDQHIIVDSSSSVSANDFKRRKKVLTAEDDTSLLKQSPYHKPDRRPSVKLQTRATGGSVENQSTKETGLKTEPQTLSNNPPRAQTPMVASAASSANSPEVLMQQADIDPSIVATSDYSRTKSTDLEAKTTSAERRASGRDEKRVSSPSVGLLGIGAPPKVQQNQPRVPETQTTRSSAQGMATAEAQQILANSTPSNVTSTMDESEALRKPGLSVSKVRPKSSVRSSEMSSSDPTLAMPGLRASSISGDLPEKLTSPVDHSAPRRTISNESRPMDPPNSISSPAVQRSALSSIVAETMLGHRSSIPALRRHDRSASGDLRAASKRDATLAQLCGQGAKSDTSLPTQPRDYSPLKGVGIKGNGQERRLTMTDGGTFEGWGDARGSPRSSPRPQSIRRKQSSQILDLENRLEQAMADNRALQAAALRPSRSNDSSESIGEMSRHIQSRDAQIRNKDAELSVIRTSVLTLQQEIQRLTEHNSQLRETNQNLIDDAKGRYATLQAEHGETHRQWRESSKALELLQDKHRKLTGSMEEVIREELAIALSDKEAEIQALREELEVATDKINALQQQILSTDRQSGEDFLNVRDEDYFDSACQQLCQHVQHWILRFSKFSDNRACRLSAQVNDEKVETRLDNTMLDGTDVDIYLSDRIRRRDVFMSVIMTMIWEFVFTRYLFGMDRDQRQKLKALEKTLTEIGPPRAVAQWRAITLTLLSKRTAFTEQRQQDTEAVLQEIYKTLSRLLPPPANVAEQVQESLRNVLNLAVDLSIEMRTQKAEYIMLPPLTPEYDTSGDLARKVFFNASLMNEKSGEMAPNEGLEAQQAVVRLVLFPLVVKKGNDFGESDEEVVVCPAQVLVARPPAKDKRVVRVLSAAPSLADPSFLSRDKVVQTPEPEDMV